ncbi:MAG: hypothetical protein WAW53_12225 [Candidatus Dormiibacterota bacterium]
MPLRLAAIEERGYADVSARAAQAHRVAETLQLLRPTCSVELAAQGAGGSGHSSVGAAFAKGCLNDVALPAHGALRVNVVGTMS